MTLTALVAATLLLPLVLVLLDVVAIFRGRALPDDLAGAWSDDFDLLVPIWGSTRYLTNVDYLSRYAERVVLVTTTAESPEFYADLRTIANEHGFRVFAGHVPGHGGAGASRSGAGLVRDTIVRDCHRVLTAEHVVCLDADTVTTRPIEELIGEIALHRYDFVSVSLAPSNTGRLLGRLQAHEYRSSMLVRRVVPWLVSGACHAGRRVVHRDVMNRHSLFYQGNDVEVGYLADARGYRVGHIPFEVPTEVPDRWRDWLRQRYFWAGGEFRLFIVNPQLLFTHPFFWAYGALMVFGLLVGRYYSLLHPSIVIAVVLVAYLLAQALIHRRHLDAAILLVPFYSAISSLVMTPLAFVSYVDQVRRTGTFGFIDVDRPVPVGVGTPDDASGLLVPDEGVDDDQARGRPRAR